MVLVVTTFKCAQMMCTVEETGKKPSLLLLNGIVTLELYSELRVVRYESREERRTNNFAYIRNTKGCGAKLVEGVYEGEGLGLLGVTGATEERGTSTKGRL